MPIVIQAVQIKCVWFHHSLSLWEEQYSSSSYWAYVNIICNWYSSLIKVVALENSWLIIQMTDCWMFLLEYLLKTVSSSPLAHILASLCTTSNQIQQKQSSETCYSIRTPSAAQSLLSWRDCCWLIKTLAVGAAASTTCIFTAVDSGT